MDLMTPFLKLLLGLVMAVASASLPMLLIYTERRLKLAQSDALDAFNASAIRTVSAASARGAGVAYESIVAAGKYLEDPVTRGSAISAGLAHVMSSVPAAIETTGVSQATLVSMITGELGKLLAIDPNISASAVLPAPRPAVAS